MQWIENMKMKKREREIKNLRYQLMLKSEEALELKAFQMEWDKVKWPRALKVFVGFNFLGLGIQMVSVLLINISEYHFLWGCLIFAALFGGILALHHQILKGFHLELNPQPAIVFFLNDFLCDLEVRRQLMQFAAFAGVCLLFGMSDKTPIDLAFRILVVNGAWFAFIGVEVWHIARQGCGYSEWRIDRQKKMRDLVNQKGSPLYDEYQPKAIAMFEKQVFDQITITRSEMEVPKKRRSL